MYGRNQYNIVKQLSSNLKKKRKQEEKRKKNLMAILYQVAAIISYAQCRMLHALYQIFCSNLVRWRLLLLLLLLVKILFFIFFFLAVLSLHWASLVA